MIFFKFYLTKAGLSYIISMQMKTVFNYNELQRKGYKLTPQRKVVADILCKAPHHISADEIYLKVKKNDLFFR